MSKSIAFLNVSQNGEHQLNIYDGIKLPPGEYDLVINPMDHHGLNRAELLADSESRHASTCKSPFGVCTCSAGDNF